MDFLRRFGQGVRLYVVVLGSFLLIAGVWWINGSLFQNTTAETGWPVMVGVVALAVVAVWIGRLLLAEPRRDRYVDHEEPYNWRS